MKFILYVTLLSMEKDVKIIATNKKAEHDYFIESRFEAGIVLHGCEVCSLRENSASLRDSYGQIKNGELWLINTYIAPYSHGNIFNVATRRNRKLLLHKKQIKKIAVKVKERGYTIVPLSMYFAANNKVKVEIAICKGKHKYDKRESIKQRDIKRDIARSLKEMNR